MKKSSRRRYVRFHRFSSANFLFVLYTGSYPFLIYDAKIERTRFYEKKKMYFYRFELLFSVENRYL